MFSTCKKVQWLLAICWVNLNKCSVDDLAKYVYL